MTPFELFFGLSSVILGIALAQLANALQLLLRAGRKIRWSPEAIMLSILILLIIVSVWADQWLLRSNSSFTVGECLLQVLKLIALFIAASAVLPDPKADQPTNLREHYYDNRAITYGALIVGLILFGSYRFLFGHVRVTSAAIGDLLILPALYGSLIVVRWRPWHLLVLSAVLVLFSLQVLNVKIGG